MPAIEPLNRPLTARLVASDRKKVTTSRVMNIGNAALLLQFKLDPTSLRSAYTLTDRHI